MSSIFSLIALLFWRWRKLLRLFHWWYLVIAYIALDILMKAPAYYIISHIDLTGSSTSWHRAALIEAAVDHIQEWWLAGTDYTRHWMAYGVGWSPKHIDVTNYYLRMGIDGGIPLMFLFILILAKGFDNVGQGLQQSTNLSEESQFMIWTFGASLFSHTVSFLSVSYFDQTVIFLYLTLAATCSVLTKSPQAIPINTNDNIKLSPKMYRLKNQNQNT